jgi:hypothetical protein
VCKFSVLSRRENRMKKEIVYLPTDISVTDYTQIKVKSLAVEGWDCAVGIATRYGVDGTRIESPWGEILRTCPDRPYGPTSLLYKGYRVFPGGKLAGA